MNARTCYIMMIVGAIGAVVALAGCGHVQCPPKSPATVLQKTECTFIECGPKALSIVAAVLPMIIAQDYTQAFTVIATEAPQEYECIRNAITAELVARYGKDNPRVREFLVMASAFHK